MLADHYRGRLSVENIEEGFGFVEKEILLGILFLVLFAFRAKYQALQRRVFFLFNGELILQCLYFLGMFGRHFFDQFFEAGHVVRKVFKQAHHAGQYSMKCPVCSL